VSKWSSNHLFGKTSQLPNAVSKEENDSFLHCLLPFMCSKCSIQKNVFPNIYQSLHQSLHNFVDSSVCLPILK
jgi:hypothetical protein